MKTKTAVAIIAAFTVASMAVAADLPPGKWWKNPGIAQRLALQPDQQARLDTIFRDSANDLIDQRAEIEKLTIALRAELDQAALDRDQLRRLSSALSQARGRLFERELMMLVDMRGVLTEAQWGQLRAQIERRRGERGQQRPMQRKKP